MMEIFKSKNGIAIILVGLVVIIVGFGWFFTKRTHSPAPETAPSDTGSLAPVRQTVAPWYEACIGKIGSAYDACLVGYAVSRSTIDVCESIINPETRDRCRSMVTVKRVKCGGSDIRECLATPSEGFGQFCLLSYFDSLAKGKDSSFCETFTDAEMAAQCHDAFAFIAAREIGKDKTKCERTFFTPYFRDACAHGQEWMAGMEADKDVDGLTQYQELLYGTDDRMADTDGDSYPDGTEIKGGYNALGPGRLCESVQ